MQEGREGMNTSDGLWTFTFPNDGSREMIAANHLPLQPTEQQQKQLQPQQHVFQGIQQQQQLSHSSVTEGTSGTETPARLSLHKMIDRWVTEHIFSRFFYSNPDLEDDYLVFYCRDRITPLVVVAVMFFGSLLGLSVSFTVRTYRPAVVVAAITLCAWGIGLVALLLLFVESRRLESQMESRKKHEDQQALNHSGSEDASQHRDDNNDISLLLRRNARRWEWMCIWCNTPVWIGSLGFYLAKGDCPWSDVSSCLNAFQLDGIVVFAFMLSTTICRIRAFAQLIHMPLCCGAYIILRWQLSSSAGFPSDEFRRSVVVAVLIPTFIAVATCWFVDRSERLHFEELRKLTKSKDDADRLASFASAGASSMLPSTVVWRLAHGEHVRDILTHAAVCCVGFQRFPVLSSYWSFSAHEAVQVIQFLMMSFDRALQHCTRLSESGYSYDFIKSHTLGDEHRVVVRSSSRGLNEETVRRSSLDAVLRYVCNGLLDVLSETRLDELLRKDHSHVTGGAAPPRTESCELESIGPTTTSQSLSLSACVKDAVVVSVDSGLVCCASIGMQSFVAFGPAVSRAQTLLRRHIDGLRSAMTSARSSTASAARRSDLRMNSDADNLSHSFPNSGCQIRVSRSVYDLVATLQHSWTQAIISKGRRGTNASAVLRSATSPSLSPAGVVAGSVLVDVQAWWRSILSSCSSAEGNPLVAAEQQLGRRDDDESMPPPSPPRLTLTRSSTVVDEVPEERSSLFSTWLCSVHVVEDSELAVVQNYDASPLSREGDAHQKSPPPTGGGGSPRAPTQVEARTTPMWSRGSQSDHSSAAHCIAATSNQPRQLTNLTLVREWWVQYVFQDETVETMYREHVEADDDLGRSRWEMVSMTLVSLVLVSICFINTIYAQWAGSQPMLWCVVCLAVSVMGLSVSFFATHHTPWTTYAIRMVEGVFLLAYVAVFSVGDRQSLHGSGNVYWLGIILTLLAMRERKQGLLFHFVVIIAVGALFVIILAVHAPRNVVRSAVTALLIAICAAMIVCFILWDLARREHFAVMFKIKELKVQFANDATLLQQLLELMIPNRMVGVLMDAVRASIREAENSQSGQLPHSTPSFADTISPEEMRKVTGCVYRSRLLHVWQSPFTTFIDDMPILVIRVITSQLGSSVSAGELRSFADHLERAYQVVIAALCESDERGGNVCMVKMCGPWIIISVPQQCQLEPTEKSIELVRFAVSMVRAGRREQVELSMAIHCGPLVGAVLGSSSLTFEYYGDAVSSCIAMLGSLPHGEFFATSRIVDLVELGLRGSNELLPRMVPKNSRDPLGEMMLDGETGNASEMLWDQGVRVAAPIQIRVREYGRLTVHRICVSDEEIV